jgi:transposase
MGNGLFSLITTAKLNNVEPFAYLRDVLERLCNGHAMSRILPWNWALALTAAA